MWNAELESTVIRDLISHFRIVMRSSLFGNLVNLLGVQDHLLGIAVIVHTAACYIVETITEYASSLDRSDNIYKTSRSSLGFLLSLPLLLVLFIMSFLCHGISGTKPSVLEWLCTADNDERQEKWNTSVKTKLDRAPYLVQQLISIRQTNNPPYVSVCFFTFFYILSAWINTYPHET